MSFFLGFLASAAIFGVVSLTSAKSADTENRPAEVKVTPSIPITASTLPEKTQSSSTSVMKAPADIPHSGETELFRAFLSPKPDGHSVIYPVQTGDTLTSISKKHHLAVDLVKKINGLTDDKLTVGEKLKLPTYKLSLVVDKAQNRLILKGDEEVLKTYVVSTGSNNSSPVGVFKITDKLINPTWYKAGIVAPPGSPKNLLGTRWMGITKKGFGIHGTTEPEKLGQQVTAGCIRMKNEEVEELYGIVPPGTQVTIHD